MTIEYPLIEETSYAKADALNADPTLSFSSYGNF